MKESLPSTGGATWEESTVSQRMRLSCLFVVGALSLIVTFGESRAEGEKPKDGTTAKPEAPSKPKRKTWKAPKRKSKVPNPIPSSKKSIARGRALYDRECASCHGKAGKGNGPKAKTLTVKLAPLNAKEIQAQTDGALFWKIQRGRRPMPGFKKMISADDTWHLVNLLRQFKK